MSASQVKLPGAVSGKTSGIDSSNIDLVFVGGRQLVVGGEADVDLDHVRQLVGEAADRVIHRSEAVS